MNKSFCSLLILSSLIISNSTYSMGYLRSFFGSSSSSSSSGGQGSQISEQLQRANRIVLFTGLAEGVLATNEEFRASSPEEKEARIDREINWLIRKCIEVGQTTAITEFKQRFADSTTASLSASSSSSSSQAQSVASPTQSSASSSPSSSAQTGAQQAELEHQDAERGAYIVRSHKITERKKDSVLRINAGNVQCIINHITGENKSEAFIFDGPSGSGKSTLAQAIAQDLGIDYVVINSSTVIGRWQGSDGRNPVAIFDDAIKRAKNKKFIIILEEIDRLLMPSKNDDKRNTTGAMQVKIDEIGNHHKNITIVGTSNYADEISKEEIKRRFPIIEIPFPNDEQYTEMIRIKLEENFVNKSFTDTQIKYLQIQLARRSLSVLEIAILAAEDEIIIADNTSSALEEEIVNAILKKMPRRFPRVEKAKVFFSKLSGTEKPLQVAEVVGGVGAAMAAGKYVFDRVVPDQKTQAEVEAIRQKTQDEKKIADAQAKKIDAEAKDMEEDAKKKKFENKNVAADSKEENRPFSLKQWLKKKLWMQTQVQKDKEDAAKEILEEKVSDDSSDAGGGSSAAEIPPVTPDFALRNVPGIRLVCDKSVEHPYVTRSIGGAAVVGVASWGLMKLWQWRSHNNLEQKNDSNNNLESHEALESPSMSSEDQKDEKSKHNKTLQLVHDNKD